MASGENYEDILKDALGFIGGTPIADEETVHFGRIAMTIAPKEGKANTLLADQLFSPAFLLAERIERGLIDCSNQTVVELGAGCALPSMLLASRPDSPSVVAITDHPAPEIFNNLRKNVERNRPSYNAKCSVSCLGYEWGSSPKALLEILSTTSSGFDVVILSDLLHFDSPEILVSSVSLLLAKSNSSRVFIAAGKYTKSPVCDRFFQVAELARLSFEEVVYGEEESAWLGQMDVSNMSVEDLVQRKMASRFWTGRWSSI